MNQKHSGKIIDKIKGFKIIECNDCGFKHAVPIPGEKKLKKMYAEWFYQERKPDYFAKQEKDAKWWQMVYEERVKRLKKYSNGRIKRVLDIGCGPGFFTKFFMDKGWRAVGVEPSATAAKYAHKMGIKVVNDFFEEKIIKKLGKFDIVHLQGVMEHLPNPKKTLKLCHKVLKPNGLLFLVVANDYNPLQKILREQFAFKPWWLVPPEHINYFDIKTLKDFVNNQGFKVTDLTTTFPMELFVIMGNNYVSNEKIGRKCHQKRKRFEMTIKNSHIPNLKEELYRFFAKKGVGRDIELIARRRER